MHLHHWVFSVHLWSAGVAIHTRQSCSLLGCCSFLSFSSPRPLFPFNPHQFGQTPSSSIVGNRRERDSDTKNTIYRKWTIPWWSCLTLRWMRLSGSSFSPHSFHFGHNLLFSHYLSLIQMGPHFPVHPKRDESWKQLCNWRKRRRKSKGTLKNRDEKDENKRRERIMIRQKRTVN